MSAVLEAVGDVFEAVGDAIGDVVEGVFDVVETIVEEVVEPVMETVGKTIEAAMDDPLGTIAKVATAIYAPYLLPLTNAAVTLANGGDLGDALESAALTYVAQGVGQYAGQLGDQVGASLEYGTELGSQQTAMLAAQNAGMGSIGDLAGNVVGSTAAGIVRGQDPLDALMSGSISTATNLLTRDIPGFSEMSPAAQRSINMAVSATLQGGDPSVALLNAALNVGIAEAQSQEIANRTSAMEEKAAATNDGGITTPKSDAFAPKFDDFSGMPQETGLASLETLPVSFEDDGLASLQENPDGTFSQKMSDGSEIIKDENGKYIGVKSAAEVAFEEQAEKAQEGKTIGEKTQDEMTPQDWAAMYATPSTNPVTGETIVGADPSIYNVQDLGLGEKVDFSAYDDPFLAWTKNDDGSRTYKYDDGSTLTADEDGNILGVTNATDTPYKPGTNPVAKPGSSISLNSVNVNPGSQRPGMNAMGVGSAILGGAAVLDSLGNDSGGADEEAARKRLVMNWNQQGVNSLVDGAAYGQKFFDPTFKEVEAARGGLMSLASGGPAKSRYNLGSYSDGGRMLRGPGDGMSDHIPATIAGKQPARLADGEFVIPADVVSHLGNGSSDAGSRVLYKMMEKIRRARTGNSKQGKKINPNKFVPR